MSLRLATFNVENLLTRFDFTGFRNQLRQDRVIKLFQVSSEGVYQQLEQARVIAATDDTRQMSALAIADADADILCLQEIDNMAALQAFEYGYLFRMVGNGYRQKFLVEGNDSRGIDVAVLMREETRDGQKIELKDIRSHAMTTYRDLDLFDEELALTNRIDDKIFKRDCLELDLLIGGRPFSLYVVHFKSMGNPRDGLDGRQSTMPIRRAEARAVRRIIEDRFSAEQAGTKSFAICGDMNDYQERVDVIGRRGTGYRFEHQNETESALDVFSSDGFAENVVRRRAPSTAGRFIMRAGHRSSGCANSTISGFRQHLPPTMPAACPKSSAAASPTAPSSRRGRKWSVIRAPAGTGRRRPIIAPSS